MTINCEPCGGGVVPQVIDILSSYLNNSYLK